MDFITGDYTKSPYANILFLWSVAPGPKIIRMDDLGATLPLIEKIVYLLRAKKRALVWSN